MQTEKQIITSYKWKHDDLSESYYSGKSLTSKKEFDKKHGRIWQNMDLALIEAGYKRIPGPVRDLFIELDEVKERLEKIERLI